MNGLEPLIPIALFFSIAGTVILRGPLGKALAERISGRASAREVDADGASQLGADLEEVRYRLQDVEERLDFTERVLARREQPSALPGD